MITDINRKVIAISTETAFRKIARKISIYISSILIVDFISDVLVANWPPVCWILNNRIMTEGYSSTFNGEVIISSKVYAKSSITDTRTSYNVKDINFFVAIKLV